MLQASVFDCDLVSLAAGVASPPLPEPPVEQPARSATAMAAVASGTSFERMVVGPPEI